MLINRQKPEKNDFDLFGKAVKGIVITGFLALGGSAVYGFTNARMPDFVAQQEILPENYGELTEGIVSLNGLSRMAMQQKYNEKMEDGKITVQEYQELATEIHEKQVERVGNAIESVKNKFKM